MSQIHTHTHTHTYIYENFDMLHAPNYNGGCTSRTIYNNFIPKGGKHIFNVGTTTYDDNIHQNILRSYKYINTLS